MTRKEVLAEMVKAFRQDFNDICQRVQDAPDGEVIERVEFEARRMAMARYAQVVEKAVELRQKGWLRKKTPVCPCGEPMRMVSQRPKSILCAVGELRFKRRYYRCDRCGASRVPFDDEVGLHERYTQGAKRLMALCGCEESFEQASGRLKELAGLSVSAGTVRTKTEQLAHQVRQRQQSGQLVVPTGPGKFAGELRAYLTMDATKVNTREDGWRDVKLAALYTQRLEIKHFAASLCDASEFGLLVRRHAAAVGIWETVEKIGAGDGADWIWRQLQINFPFLDRQVLDYFHLCENIYKAAWRLYPEGSAQGQRWAGQKKKLALRRGGVQLIRSLRASLQREKRAQARQALQALLAYMEKHRERMDYPELTANGIHIGTGPLESGCKNVIGKRLKGRGMRWSVCNAEAMACLRAVRASTGCWDALWQMRALAA